VAALRAQAPPSAPSEQESVGALVTRLGIDVGRIVRAELALFQVRVAAALDNARYAALAVAAGAVFGLVGIGIVMLGLVYLLGSVLPLWAAAFAVGGTLLVVAAILIKVERRALTQGVTAAFSDEGAHHGE
jgi:hypothetical protein